MNRSFRTGTFVARSLAYYWKRHILLALGIALSGMVITGALMVGDSVSYSLNRIVDQRLGTATHSFRSEGRYFTDSLAQNAERELGIPVTSVLLQEGSAIAGGGRIRLNNIRVLGVDAGFDRFSGGEPVFSGLSGDTVLISANLADRLGAGPGDEILVRMERASLIPANAPFVSDADRALALRVTIGGIATTEQMGRFSLEVSQTAPFNLFIRKQRLQEVMDFPARSNLMLIRAGEGTATGEIRRVLGDHFGPGDAGLELELTGAGQLGENLLPEDPLPEGPRLEVSSRRVFLDDTLASLVRESLPRSEAIVTYFVNRISRGNRSTPYSFVSTLPDSMLGGNGIVVNRWLAEDLGAGEGDTVTVAYFRVGPLRELEEDSARFVIRQVVSIRGRYADPRLMPDLPGLSDVGNCRDWETGVPIDLEAIRDRDEDYWDTYGGTPKAFVAAQTGASLWHNRFGTYTAIRGAAAEGGTGTLREELTRRIDPAILGFVLEESRSKGLEAAGKGVDFSQLFAGLSFFLLVAGILLSVLLFLLGIESRHSQLQTLVRLGIPESRIRRMYFMETAGVAGAGSLLGVLLALGYNRLVFIAMNGVWKDVVRTDTMVIDIRAVTVLTGTAITLLVAGFTLWFVLRRRLKKMTRSHQAAARGWPLRGRNLKRVYAYGAPVAGSVSLGLILFQLILGQQSNASLFFVAGSLLLIASLFLFLLILERRSGPAGAEIDPRVLAWKNASRNRTRSIAIVILFSLGAFLVISTGSNRRDPYAGSGERDGGTGGFLYFAESTLPVLERLNDPKVRSEYGLEGDYSFVQMRKAEGDDASCLNLNRIVNPMILGVRPGALTERFSFVTRTPFLDGDDPWGSLEQKLEGGLVPAIADETVIKWGLGLEVGDTLRYINSEGQELRLLLIGGLAPSVFQGHVLISRDRFLEAFPSSSGTHVFLIDGQVSDTARIREEVNRAMRDLGWDMERTAARLAEFNSVTNTYLSIFMVMGALGLVLGTFGLVVILSRSILERRREIALLKAVGFSRGQIRRLIVREYLWLLSAGILSGFGSAVIATLPSLTSVHTGAGPGTVAAWLAVITVNGWFWIQLVTRSSLNDPRIYRGLRND